MAHAFISYSRKDTEFVEKLERDLNARGIITWRDATSIPGGDDWYKHIERGLENAYAVICIVTPNADESIWVRREQLRADEDKIPRVAVHPKQHRNPLHLQEIQPIVMDTDEVYASGLARLVAKLSECRATPRKAPIAAVIAPTDPAAELRARVLHYLTWVLSEAKADLRDALYVDLSASQETVKRPKVRLSNKWSSDLDDDMFTFTSVQMERLDGEDFGKAGQDVPDARKALLAMRQVVLLGEPGAGKTTTLRKLTVDLAREAQSDPNAKLPVYVPLREFNGANSFSQFVREQAHNLKSDFDALLKSGHLMLLCDALNEMPRIGLDGRDLMSEVKTTLTTTANWIVSCRVRDYQEDLSSIDGVGKIRLKPLDPIGIHDFIQRKFTAWNVPERGAALWRELGGSEMLLSAWRKISDKGEGERFWDSKTRYIHYIEMKEWNALHALWGDHRRLMGLACSPFMSNMLCALYRKGDGRLPSNRAGLFTDFVKNLLAAEQARREVVGWAWIDDDAIRIALSQIAWAMASQTELPITEAKNLIALHATVYEPTAILKLAADSGLIDHGQGVRFTHQLIQEYFAASVLGVLMDAGTDAASLWKPENWWEPTGREETAILLAGVRADPESVARWIAPAQPWFAVEILQQPDFSFEIAKVANETRSVLVNSAKAKIDTINPIGRAEAYRVLGVFDVDERFGIGLRADGLPEFDWVDIPEGEFIYGDNDRNKYLDIAKPAEHQTLMLSVYKISRYLVTYKQFQAFIDAPDGFYDSRWWEGFAEDEYYDRSRNSPGNQRFKYWNHPRETVNWYDSMVFCRWFSYKLGHKWGLDEIDQWAIRLPTEYEWEKAARGRDGRSYPYANKLNKTKGNISQTGIRYTSAVGIFVDGMSSYGVLDMSGNVWEWCLNNYTDPVIDLMTENLRTSNRRVLRGGSYIGHPYLARSAARYNQLAHARIFNTGFRVVSRPLSLE